MVTAIIFRELRANASGKRAYVYTFAVNMKLEPQEFHVLTEVRTAAAGRLKYYPDNNQIVEDWPDGKRFYATSKGTAQRSKVQTRL
jgi:hypothetical protein